MVFNIGSINIDYVYRVPHFVAPGETLASKTLTKVLGGKGANQSVAIAQAGADVSHVGRLSTSDAWAIQEMSDFGINTQHVVSSAEPSGHAVIQVDDSGENAIVLHGGANQQLTKNQLNRALSTATSNDWLLIQNECNGLNDVFAIAAAKNVPIVFNPAPMGPEVLDLPLKQTHCLILNEVEAAGIAGDSDALVVALVERFPDSLIALTLGAEGVQLIDKGQAMHIKAPKVNAVDTTGAGDTFVGYFLSNLMVGKAAEDAAYVACHAAALSVTVDGAAPSIPVQGDVLRFMKKHANR